jgi:hypothetical protein
MQHALAPFFITHVLPRRLPSAGQSARLVESHILHTPSTLVVFLDKVHSAQLVTVLRHAERNKWLGDEVLLVCAHVSALRSTFKSKSAEFNVRITVISADPSDTHFHHPLAYGLPYFDLPQTPRSVSVVPTTNRKTALMHVNDPLAIAYGLQEGERVRIVERVGCDLEDNALGIYASNMVSYREVV